MDGAEVGVFEQTYEVRLRRLLQAQHRRRLAPQLLVEAPHDLSDQPLKWQLANQQLGTFLVPPDLAQRHGARADCVKSEYVIVIVIAITFFAFCISFAEKHFRVAGFFFW